MDDTGADHHSQAPKIGGEARWGTMDHQHSELAENDEEAANRQTASLAAVAVTLLLLTVGLFLVLELRTKVVTEDCPMASRINCYKLVQSARVTRPHYLPGGQSRP